MLVTMEGSSDSAWENSDSSRALNPPSISGWNFRLVHSDRVGFPGNAHKDSGFRKVRDVVPSALVGDDRNQEGFCGICEEDVLGDPCIRPTEPSDLCLREWLDKPDRSIDEYECLHIFRQILDIVNIAHSEGVVLHNIRPSCFMLSSYNHVSFVDSAHVLGSESISFGEGLRRNNVAMHEQLGLMSDDFPSNITSNTNELFEASGLQSRLVYEARRSLIEENEGNKVIIGRRFVEQEEGKISFPPKKTMLIESSWYTSPEELDGLPSSWASNVYCLGVLLYELFCEFKSREEKGRIMSSLRNRVLPPQLLLKWPKEASFCLLLLQPDPSRRPKVSELLQSEFLNEPIDDLQNREASLELEEKIEDQELLLEFLYLIRQKKQEAADKLQDTLSFLSLDILEVNEQKSNQEKKEGCCSELGKQDVTASNFHSSGITSEDNCATSGSRKRYRLGAPVQNMGQCDGDQDDAQKSASSEKQGSPLQRCSRLMKNFKKLESAYFLTRCRPTKKPSAQQFSKQLPIDSSGRSSMASKGRSSVHNSVTCERYANSGQSKWIDPFLEGLCKYMAFSKLRVKADLNQGDLLNSSNLVCSLGFDRDGEFFATAGVNKKIKVFECDTLIKGNREIHYPVVEMTSKSKLSSICWNTYIKSQIASSNFEGVVQIWDATRGQVLMEMTEHEKRVWSIDFSSSDPTLLASGSDDGSVKLWNINQGVSVGTINLKANVCCVQFSPDSGRSLAFGLADHKIYYYDLRNSRIPLCTLAGHSKTVSYVKFVDPMNLVSASTDNTLKLWDLSTFKSRNMDTPSITFTGHTNVKNFVGLSVCDGYIATGSETNEVFIYQKAFPMPAMSYKFGDAEFVSGQDTHGSGQFVSSVCWRGQSSTLVAANSTGNIKILEMV